MVTAQVGRRFTAENAVFAEIFSQFLRDLGALGGEIRAGCSYAQ